MKNVVSQGYPGGIVTVSSPSANPPSSWGPSSKEGLTFNLDVRTPSQFGSPADLALISTWTSDQGHAWTKFSDATRPYYAANAGGGYPGIMFAQAGAQGGLRYAIPGAGTDYFVVPGRAFCILLVFRPTNIGPERVMMTFEHGTSGPPFIELNFGRVAFQSNNGTWRSWRTDTVLSANTTNYAVINYNGGTATDINSYTCYVNGVQETLTAAANGAATDFNILGDYSGGNSGDRFQGALMQIAMWSAIANAADLSNIGSYVSRHGIGI